MKVQILGMGHALPAGILNNRELEQMVDTSDEWILERTGIRERRIAAPGEATSDFCCQAAKMALERSATAARDLDLIIVGTSTPDMVFPSTACQVQDRLGAGNAAAFDVEAGCTGFIYALTIAEKFLLSPEHKKILVIGADLCSRFTDYTDRNTCVLFGDGAGAAVVGKADGLFHDNSDSLPGNDDKGPGILSSFLGSDGSGGKHLYVPAGGSAIPASLESVEQRLHFMKMDGNEIFRFATRIVVKVSERLLARAGLSYQDIDMFIPHQANLRIIRTAMKRMRIPAEKALINLDRFGNMSAACIPVGLSMAEEEGKLKKGDIVLMVAFGAGLSYGGTLLRWGRDQDAF